MKETDKKMKKGEVKKADRSSSTDDKSSVINYFSVKIFQKIYSHLLVRPS